MCLSESAFTVAAARFCLVHSETYLRLSPVGYYYSCPVCKREGAIAYLMTGGPMTRELAQVILDTL